MLLSEAQKILQKKYKEKHCSVKVECSPNLDGNIDIVWVLYVGDTTTGFLVEAFTFKEALKKTQLMFYPKKNKSQNVEIKEKNHGKK